MRLVSLIYPLLHACPALSSLQIPFLHHDTPAPDRSVSPALFTQLEELARVVDISYCISLANVGISKPFTCLSRCSEFPDFELIKTWNTGPLVSDSAGYIAVDHAAAHPRIIVAFRGTYSITNAVVDLSTIPQEYVPYPGDPESPPAQHEKSESNQETPKCNNCTVHMGFYQSWRVTYPIIKPEIEFLVATYPHHKLHLVGHSLGGAVATLAGLDFRYTGWDPIVTTFGEPRLGNKGLMQYIDSMFNLRVGSPSRFGTRPTLQSYEDGLTLRRVTHVDDPVPQLPLAEWGFRMHAGEIFISKSELSPDIQDIQHCFGDEDPECIAGQDSSLVVYSPDAPHPKNPRRHLHQTIAETVKEAGLWESTGGESVTIPARYRLWQMLYAHRDYFWRLGLCVPSGTPWNSLAKPYASIELDELNRLKPIE